MFENLDVMRMAQSMARHAGIRQAVVAENIAHADTPGYKARDIADFSANYEAPGTMRATRPTHLNGTQDMSWEPFELDLPASGNGNSVSLETEMFRSVEIKRHHDRALAVYQHSMEILRTSLGRR